VILPEFGLLLYSSPERFMLLCMFSFDIQACFFLLTFQVLCNTWGMPLVSCTFLDQYNLTLFQKKSLGFRVWGLGFRVSGLGLGFRV
jgi:hypothetical protein